MGSIIRFSNAAEVGVTDWLSVGTQLGLGPLVWFGLAEGTWVLQASFLARVNLLDVGIAGRIGYLMNVVTEIQPDPLITFSSYSANVTAGLLSWYTTLGNNLRLLRTPGFRLYAYLDLKHVMTFANPLFRSSAQTAEFWFSGLTPEQASQIPVSIDPTGKIGVAAGFDAVWGILSMQVQDS